MSDNLRFDADKYEVKTCELDGRSIIYRAFEGIDYCANPVDPIQKLNLFVPEIYYREYGLNGYTLQTAPIFVSNTVGGYMPGPADIPGKDSKGEPNTVFRALEHGYVVACPGIRGRTSGRKGDEFFAGDTAASNEEKTGKSVGKAPALIVDMKAVVRYLRHNKGLFPVMLSGLLQMAPVQAALCLPWPGQLEIVLIMFLTLLQLALLTKGMTFLRPTAIVRFITLKMPMQLMNGYFQDVMNLVAGHL